ncbi:MAG TPA: cobyric acid synthase [Candidatus Binatia bacterium]|nr:cobyric acid synthase [Candidatus Binatia bacterium]
MLAQTLMIQGTGSSVGKSILVTALCRIFKQQGLRVAPFKAQNMSLNSYVTAAGGEIGRAQVVQAEAAGIAPTVEMNPVLLKPASDQNAQIIVRGKPWTTISAARFPELKAELWAAITESIDALRRRFDLVVIEGAGSPAEINLKERDLVNMKVALYCNSPVLLAADIDRGGVFAALIGTMDLLEPEERALVKAFIVNKFRGDLSLLTPGISWLEHRTGIPVAGVIPYYHDIFIAEEDSLALERRRAMKNRCDHVLDIAVIAPPHIANFDDFDPLERESGVRLRYVEREDLVGNPDLIILPGSKSTVADLDHLRNLGRDQEITDASARGIPIIGICAGYQMLGLTIRDPEGVESARPVTAGLSLLPVTTRFSPQKSTHQVKARTLLERGILAQAKDCQVTGYEIHMGETTSAEVAPPFQIEQRSKKVSSDFDGALSADGNVLGTYIHGLFHNDDFRRGILQELADRKGKVLPPAHSRFSADEQYDRLAALVRDNLDMDLILRLLDRS